MNSQEENKTNSLELESEKNEEIINEKVVDNNANEILKEKKKKNGGIKIVLIIAGILLILCGIVAGLYFFIVNPAMIETANYNNIVNTFNVKADEYNASLTKVDISNVSGASSNIDHLQNVNSDMMSVIQSLKNGNSVEKIKNDIETLKKYTNEIDEDIKVLQQLENPSKEWVIERLKKVNMINGIEAVTEGNDPNELLKKEDGGYNECIYFTLNNIKQNEVEGNTVVEKGTDGGGAIEVYVNKEDAEKRCEYLADFDNSILYSGSYVILGTMVIRISYILTDEQQCYITDLIINAFTK